METKEKMIEKAKTLMAAGSCCAELKAVAQKWIDSVGTSNEKSAAKAFIDEITADVLTNEAIIKFMNSDAGKAHFGAEIAGGIAKHAEEIMAKGAKYCDCPACTAGMDILNNKEAIL